MRNSQASVLAPTGTIGLLMDCDTTGIEPDLGLVKTKKLVGGGTMSIVNQTVPRALRPARLRPAQVDEIVAYIDEHKSIVGAPHLTAEHLPVFACSMGDNTDPLPGPHPDDGCGAAVHQRRHLQDGQHARGSDRRGRRAAPHRGVAARAQGGRHLPGQLQGGPAAGHRQEDGGRSDARRRPRPTTPSWPSRWPSWRRPSSARPSWSSSRSGSGCPAGARSSTFAFRVADCEGYVTVGEYDDGRPGEVFMKVSKQGSTLAGIMDAFAIAVSLGLQHGVPLATYVKKYTNMRFEPAGMTDDPELRIAQSLVDYIFRRLAVDYLPYEERVELGVLTSAERTQQTLPGVEEAATRNLARCRAGGGRRECSG